MHADVCAHACARLKMRGHMKKDVAKVEGLYVCENHLVKGRLERKSVESYSCSLSAVLKSFSHLAMSLLS